MIVENLQLNILAISVKDVRFEIVSDSGKTNHSAKIVNKDGIFGVEFSKDISLKLSYYPAETKSFVKNLRAMYSAADKLRAA